MSGATRPDRQDVTFCSLIPREPEVERLEATSTNHHLDAAQGLCHPARDRAHHRYLAPHHPLVSAALCRRPGKLPGVATDSPVQTAPPWPPTGLTVPLPVTTSKCEPHRAFIDAQLRLGRNATAIYQDLVDLHGFDGAYNCVKRFAGRPRRRNTAVRVLDLGVDDGFVGRIEVVLQLQPACDQARWQCGPASTRGEEHREGALNLTQSIRPARRISGCLRLSSSSRRLMNRASVQGEKGLGPIETPRRNLQGNCIAHRLTL